MLIGQFLGTGAAEGIPTPFCHCPTCEQARKVGGQEMRLRTSFRLSDSIMVDLGADAVTQAIKYGDLSAVNHVLVTHTHDDHLNAHMLMQCMWAREHRETLHYYFTDKAFDIVDAWRNSPWVLKGRVREFEEKGYVAFHKLNFGERVKIDGIGVTPLKGNHVGNMQENSALYLMELPDGRKLFYGLDTGADFPETLDALKAHHIDMFISENTGGASVGFVHDVHMCLDKVKVLADALVAQGTLDADSTLYLTHISHRSGHAQNVAAVENMQFPVKTVVTYDGMKIL